MGKSEDSCEDAYFISEEGFGVADGVSGWNDYGFSSKGFATELMDNCRGVLERKDWATDEKVGHKNHPAVNILNKAFGQVKNVGSSTAIVGLLLNSRLELCNLGDSGF